ncbi:hypothetical protein [Sinomicrobium weinanense]|uniref:Fibronectin type-III domain-containing protein n=1 Tax=Sinomicrobium weinanense TaxID=2842200 RepID=A0A926JSL3_9FLAO|nr:hypothetical protein [Sinomicrobium weinanense]MBC9796757.1 hypothetical protein [Sinomicrobium weinanense]MBU3124028.1 hypothetical protein [Sinomicrobium weinanense]
MKLPINKFILFEKLNRLTLTLVFLTLSFTICCNDDDGPSTPGAATLVFPENNSECTTGIEVDSVTSRVTFEWEPSERTDIYRLNVQDLNSGTTEEYTTEAASLGVVLQKGHPYSWTVTSISNDIPETTRSESWKFYNAGDGTESYAPFPATVISPEQDETIPVGEGSIALQWEGNDIDGDITAYDVYFGNVNPPETAIAEDLDVSILDGVSVSPKTVYYWRVVTKDSQGNRSESEVFIFKVN